MLSSLIMLGIPNYYIDVIQMQQYIQYTQDSGSIYNLFNDNNWVNRLITGNIAAESYVCTNGEGTVDFYVAYITP